MNHYEFILPSAPFHVKTMGFIRFDGKGPSRRFVFPLPNSFKEARMSTIREILRVLFAGGMTYREIGGIIGISHNTVSRYDRLRVEKSITLDEIEAMDDTALENSFNARPLSCDADRPLPDFELWHRELKIRGVTIELLWQEYRADHPTTV